MNKIILSSKLVAISIFFLATPVLAAPMQKYWQGTAKWKSVPNTQCYNIYYKESTQKIYQNAVGCLPPNMTSYTIKMLKPKTSYKFNVSAMDSSMNQFSWFGDRWLPNLQPQK